MVSICNREEIGVLITCNPRIPHLISLNHTLTYSYCIISLFALITLTSDTCQEHIGIRHPNGFQNSWVFDLVVLPATASLAEKR